MLHMASNNMVECGTDVVEGCGISVQQEDGVY